MSELWNRMSIIGIRCEGCRMWTRITNGNMELVRYLTEKPEPYYCDECQDNVTFRETFSKLTLG